MPTANDIREQIFKLEADLRAAEEAERKEKEAANAARAISLIYAMRAAYKEVERLYPGTFDADKWAAANTPQAWPRTGRFVRMADLSETELANAKEAGEKAVMGLK